LLRLLKGSESNDNTNNPHENSNWNTFYVMAKIHGVIGPVAKKLHILEASIPKEIASSIHSYNKKNACQSLKLTRALLKIIKVFNQHNLRMIPFKGPMLSTGLHGSPAMRAIGDLDILVAPEDMPEAQSLLLSLGYHHKNLHIDHQAKRNWSHLPTHSVFTLDQQKIKVELHWRLETIRDFDKLWQKRYYMNVMNTQVACMDQEALTCYLCYHGSKHLWYKLMWLYDLSSLINRVSEESITSLIHRANSLGIHKRVVTGLLLAYNLLDAKLPDSFLKTTNNQSYLPALKRIVKVISMAHNTEMPAHVFSKYFYIKLISQYHLCESGREKFMLCLNKFKPTEEEIFRLNLPRPLYFMYGLSRPIFWIKRRLTSQL